MDLRDNLGGLTQQAIHVADCFLPEGKLITTQVFRGNDLNPSYATDSGIYFKAVALVNNLSASSAEIVASALQDNGVAIVGEKTFGKGTIQTVVPTREGGALWLTIGQYLTPKGEAIHKIGLTPDYVVANEVEKPDMSKMLPLKCDTVYKTGDKGDEIAAIKQRLNQLGYAVEQNDYLDEHTAAMIKSFQAQQNLFPYGVADKTTQKALDKATEKTGKVIDKQLEKAVELINKL